MKNMLPNNYDTWRLASPYDNESKYECEQCQESCSIDNLIETTSFKNICENCIENFSICDCCDKPIDTDQSWDNESCDSCNESKGDKDFNMER